MKKNKSIKLQLIRMLSDPYVMITSMEVSNEIKPIPMSRDDINVSDGFEERKLTGHSIYIIEIYKEPKNENAI